MATIADIRIVLAALPPGSPTLESFADQLEVLAANIARQRFPAEWEIDLVVEEGSVKGAIKILGSLYVAIAMYGDFRSGVDAIIHDTNTVVTAIEDALEKKGAHIEEVAMRPAVPERLRQFLELAERASTGDPASITTALREREKLLRGLRDERDRSLVLESVPLPARPEVPQEPPPRRRPHPPEAVEPPEIRIRRRRDQPKALRPPRGAAARYRVHKRRYIGA